MSVDRLGSPARSAHGLDNFSELLHRLSQPLTALHCTLELALQRDDTVESFRRSAEAALENAARLQRCLWDAREMREADDPGDISQPIRADLLLMRVWEELLPLAEAAGAEILPMCEPVWIQGNEEKLAWALFSLTTFVLSSCSANDVIELRGVTNVDRLKILVTPVHTSEGHNAAEPAGPLPAHQLEVLQRTLAAVGGELSPPSRCSSLKRSRVLGAMSESCSWGLQLLRTNAALRQ